VSSFVAATEGHQSGLLWYDRRLQVADYPILGAIFAECTSAVAPATFGTEWWPRGGGLVGDGGADVGILDGVQWGDFYPAAGAASRYGFVGRTRDQWGTEIATCTVYLFRTSDNTLIDTTTSDSAGNFLLNTAYYPDTHYIVAHKSGSPDVDGVTPNTLIGT